MIFLHRGKPPDLYMLFETELTALTFLLTVILNMREIELFSQAASQSPCDGVQVRIS